MPALSVLWSRAVLKLFGDRIERVNERLVLVADDKKIAKAGKKMPAVKSLFQKSESNTKPSSIMGHSTQAISILAHAADELLAVPLDIKIHEGLIFSNRDRRTLLDKLVTLVSGLGITQPCYLGARVLGQIKDHHRHARAGARPSDPRPLGQCGLSLAPETEGPSAPWTT